MSKGTYVSLFTEDRDFLEIGLIESMRNQRRLLIEILFTGEEKNMKNRVGKMILLAGILCVMSFAVCACGGEKEASEAQQEEPGESIPEDSGEPVSEDEKQDRGVNGETVTETETADTEDEPGNKEVPAESEWDSTPSLEGDIKEIEDGQFTVVEAFTEKSDDGGDIIVLPADGGDDSGFDKVSVTYDENTLFVIRTIYDGGARSELSEATSADLASGQFVRVWGSFSDSGLKAVQICIVKVA